LTTAIRIGVYGGAFDPPHLAHVSLAQHAIAQLHLEQLIVLPTGCAWHKTRELTQAVHRIAMAQMAFSSLANLRVDARETRRTGRTYTIDTLEQLQTEHVGAQLFLLMGQDQFEAFASWHRWQDIAHLATICIAARAVNTPTCLENHAPSEVQTQCKIAPINMPDMPISATDIRQRVKAGQRIDHLVKPEVAKYIAHHSLYIA
jgi:nicotinate-nucleotide adenylyltransferase